MVLLSFVKCRGEIIHTPAGNHNLPQFNNHPQKWVLNSSHFVVFSVNIKDLLAGLPNFRFHIGDGPGSYPFKINSLLTPTLTLEKSQTKVICALLDTSLSKETEIPILFKGQSSSFRQLQKAVTRCGVYAVYGIWKNSKLLKFKLKLKRLLILLFLLVLVSSILNPFPYR